MRVTVLVVILAGGLVHARSSRSSRILNTGKRCEAAENATACQEMGTPRRAAVLNKRGALVARRVTENGSDERHEPWRRRRQLRTDNGTGSLRAVGRFDRGGSRAEHSDFFGYRALCMSPATITLVAGEGAPPSGPTASSRPSAAASGVHGCVHKALLAPHVTVLDTLTMVFIFGVAALALAAGIGGGGLYVPTLNLMLRFRPHVAVGLSQCLICGGAIGALMINSRERHPLSRGRPLIDLSLAAFLSPAEMAGA